MKARARFLSVATLISLVLAHVGCADPGWPLPSSDESDAPDAQEAANEDVADEEEEAPDDAAPTESCSFVDMNGNRLDYGHPAHFLSQGGQSFLSPDHTLEIRGDIGALDKSIKSVGTIFEWKNGRFSSEAAGGEYVGRLSSDEIMERGTLTGCHDHGLILASVLREYGFPSVMVDAAGIQWALDHAAGDAQGYSGHVFVEALTEEGWILLDSTSGHYIYDYEPCEPVIPLPKSIEPKGYYVLLKGLDPDDYGVESIDDLKGVMLAFAEKTLNIDFCTPEYDVRQLPR